MKILHLSDLHLGKRVYEMSMLSEQRVILEQAIEMAKEADVTLIAGDIYDRQVPPAEAVALFDSFLSRMHAQGSRIVMIAGNHDSAERIAFGADLLEASDVHVSPVYDGRVRRVEFEDEYGKVHIHLLPFVKPAHVRAALENEEIDGYSAAICEVVTHMKIDTRVRNVLLAHQFVTGSTRSESEEFCIGGLDNVDADVFADFDYVALGHLHGAQSLCGGRIRYCGAPLAYAFSECGDQKGALLIELREKGNLDVQMRPFVPAHAMRRIRGTFDTLFNSSRTTEDYLQITLTDEEDIPEAARKLAQIYPNLLQVIYDNTRTRAIAADFGGRVQAARSPMEMFEALFELQNGQGMMDAQRAYLAGMMETIWEDEA